MIYDISIEGKTHRVEVLRSNGGWICKLDGEDISVNVSPAGESVLSLLVEGKSYEVKRDSGPTGMPAMRAVFSTIAAGMPSSSIRWPSWM